MKARGFTLLEMLITLTLVSLLFLALFAAFNTIGRSWDAADTRMNKTEDMRLISEFLRRQLGQAMVVKIKGEKEANVYAFSGTSNRVRYAAPLQPLQHQGGVFLIELSIINGKSGGKALVMRYAPYRPELTWEQAFKDAEPVPVFDGLKSAAFAYFGAEDLKTTPEWAKDWEDKPLFPQLLKLQLADAERAWADIVIQLPQVSDYAK